MYSHHARKMLDSSRPEPFIALCPHRLPLPPLLAAQTPLESTTKSASRPYSRIYLVPAPCLTAVDSPLEQSESRFYQAFYTASNVSLTQVNLSDLISLQRACQRAQRPLAEALAYWNMGIAWENAGAHNTALGAFTHFVAPCERSGYIPGVVSGLSSQGVSLFLQGNYYGCVARCEAALQRLDAAYDVVYKTSGGWLSSNYLAASLLLNIGLSFIYLYDYEAATLALARALQHALQAYDSSCEASVCAAYAVCNALSGDFYKVDSCLDRFVELSGVVETGLETTLGLKSLRIVERYQVVQNVPDTVRSATRNACVALLRIASLARVHGHFERARHFAQRAHNVAIMYGFQDCSVLASCAVGVAEGSLELAEADQTPSTTYNDAQIRPHWTCL